MKKIITLNNNKDFKRAYIKGKTFVSPVVVIYILKNRGKQHRIGITASKKIGNAVKRNRARRIILQAFKSLNLTCKNGTGYDFVFVARGKTPYVKSTDIFFAMVTQFKKAGVL